MTTKADENKKLNKLFVEYLNSISSGEESEKFLKEQGFDVDDLLNSGLRKIKQINSKIKAENSEQEFEELKVFLVKAKEMVRKLLSDPGFNLGNFIKKEKINMAYRNFTNMSKEEIQEFLERHYALKLKNENEKES